MNFEFILSFTIVGNIGNLAIKFLPIFFTPGIDFLLLLRAEFIVQFLSNLEFECEWDGWLPRGVLVFLGRAVVVVVDNGLLLSFPASDDDGLDDVPVVGAIRLYRRKLPLLVDVELQIPARCLDRIRATALVVKPPLDLLASVRLVW